MHTWLDPKQRDMLLPPNRCMLQSTGTCAFLAALSTNVLISQGPGLRRQTCTLDVHLCDVQSNHRACIKSQLASSQQRTVWLQRSCASLCCKLGCQQAGSDTQYETLQQPVTSEHTCILRCSCLGHHAVSQRHPIAVPVRCWTSLHHPIPSLCLESGTHNLSE